MTIATRLRGLAVLVPVVLLLVVPNLGDYALWDPDEARHAEIARELGAATTWSGWVLPQLNGRPYHDKPILFYWTTSLAYALGGVNEGSARATSALAMLATVLAVYAWSAARSGAGTALWSALVLATSLEFLGLGRYASLDMLFTLWATLGVLAIERWSASGRRRWAIGAGVATGLGLLTKGLAAPLLVGAAGLGLAVSRRLPPGQVARAAGAVAVPALLVAGPWYATVALLDWSYLREFLLQHHFGRFLGSARIALHPKPWWFYAPVLIGGFMPWTAALPAAMRDAWRRRHPDQLFCLAWAAAILLFFTLSRGKLGTYVVLCLPPLALLVGPYLHARWQTPSTDPVDVRWHSAGWWGVVGLGLIIVPALLGLRVVGLNFLSVSTSLYGLVLLPPAVVAGQWLRQGRVERVPLVVGASVMAASLLFYGAVAPEVSDWVSDASLARALPDPAAPLIAYQIKPASLLYYTRRAVPAVSTPQAVAARLDPERTTFVVTSPKHVDHLRAVVAVHPWRTGGRHVLLATQPPPS